MGSGWKRPLVLALFCWGLFVCVLVTAYWFGPARWADGWAVDGFLNLQRSWLTHIATAVAHLANPVPFAIWTALLAGIALRHRGPRHALAVLVLLVGSNVIAQTLKVVLEHPRPHDFLGHAQVGATSFPSGHATAAMAIAFAALLIAPPAWRAWVALGGGVFALAVSESIMFLAWHFPSDVVGGFLVATACTLMTVAGLRAAEQRWPQRTGREAARRAIRGIDPIAGVGVVSAFVVAALLGVAIAAGHGAVAFADRHTVAVAAVVGVAAMSAVLPASVAALGGRRS
jgi:membrane-associated phospholipid phosphatase